MFRCFGVATGSIGCDLANTAAGLRTRTSIETNNSDGKMVVCNAPCCRVPVHLLADAAAALRLRAR